MASECFGSCNRILRWEDFGQSRCLADKMNSVHEVVHCLTVDGVVWEVSSQALALKYQEPSNHF